MLQDSFIEGLVVRKNGINGVIFNVTAVVVAIMLIAVINVYPWLNWGSDVIPVTSFASVAIVFGLVWLMKRQHKEYEYEMSNDFFECAAIKGKEKREDLVSFSIKECEYIGPVTSDRFNSDMANANIRLKLTDLNDFPIEEKYWYFCLTHEGIKFVIVFIFKPEMYQVFRRYNPRATKPMKMPVIEKKEETNE